MQTVETIRTPVSIAELVSFDLYRDIHKAIRAELFAVTAEAGTIDPADMGERRRHASRVHALVDLLVHHAEHEDNNLDHDIERVDPTLTVEIAHAHATLDAQLVALGELADAALEAGDARAASHQLYLDLASFTAAYLQHQDFEERVVMRALAANNSVEQLLTLHEQILASVKPEVMVRCLQLMLPAINIVDRTEMLAGMRAGAPAEVFAGTWALAADVLSTREYVATAARLDLTVDQTKIG